MALIKNIDAMLYNYKGADNSNNTNDYDFTSIFTANTSNTILIEDEENEIIWLDGAPHDRVSLVPKFNLPPKAFEYLKKNVVNYFNNNMLLTKQPTLNYSHDTYSGSGTGTANINSDIEFPKYSSWNRLSNLTNNQPPYLSFQKNNEDYIIYYHISHQSSSIYDLNIGDTKIYIVKTSNYSDYSDRLEITLQGFVIPLHFDLQENTIICLSFQDQTDQPSDTAAAFDHQTELGYRLIKIDTSPLALISDTKLLDFNDDNMNMTTSIPLRHTLYWAGYDSNNNNVLLYLENTSNFVFKAANINFTGNSPAFSTINTPAHTIATNGQQLNPTIGRFYQGTNQNNPNLYLSYSPTFDANGNFQPIAILWDKGLNLSVTGQNPFSVVEVTNFIYPQGKSSSDYIYSDTFNLIKTEIDNYEGNMTAYSTCFITKAADGEWYLNHLNVIKNKSAYAPMLTQPTSLNLVTYHIIDMKLQNNPMNLEFHQALQVDCLDLLIENDNATELVIISPNSIKLLNFSNTWSVTSEYDGIYTNYTKDALGRRWATKQPLSTYTADYPVYQRYQNGNLDLIDPQISLHLLDDTIPYRTSISFNAPNQTYTGNNLNNALNVDAFDENGSRIAADVLLVIEGNDMTFNSNSGTEIIVTTLINQSLAVPVTITGPGHVSVAASFHI